MANIQKNPKGSEHSRWQATVTGISTHHPTFAEAYVYAFLQIAKNMKSAGIEGLTFNGKEPGSIFVKKGNVIHLDVATPQQIKKRGWDKLKRPAKGGETC